MLGILKLHAFVLFGLSVTSCAQISPALLSSADRSTIIESEEFKIIIHAQGGANPNSALKVAKGASAVADSIWGTLRKPQKSPHEIHVWPDKRDYQRAEAKLTQRKFRSNLAFSHYPSRTAHVALNPSTALPSVKKWGLPVQTLRLIAHEAFHLATFERVKSSRWLPDWFSEGLASFAEQRVLETSGFAPDNELLDPWASTYIAALQDLANRGRLPDLRTVLHDGNAGLNQSEIYGLRKAVLSFLHHRYPDTFKTLTRAALAIPSKATFAQAFQSQVSEEMTARPAFDDEFRTWLLAQRPYWLDRTRSLACTEFSCVQIAPSQDRAKAIRLRVSRGGYELTGAAEFLQANSKAFILFGGIDGWHRISLSPRAATPTHQARRHPNSSTYDKRSTGPLTMNIRRSEFAITVDHERIDAIVDGVRVVTDIDAPRSLAWALSVDRGNSVRWRDVVETPKIAPAGF